MCVLPSALPTRWQSWGSAMGPTICESCFGGVWTTPAAASQSPDSQAPTQPRLAAAAAAGGRLQHSHLHPWRKKTFREVGRTGRTSIKNTAKWHLPRSPGGCEDGGYTGTQTVGPGAAVVCLVLFAGPVRHTTACSEAGQHLCSHV